jgi:Na+/proline symporter
MCRIVIALILTVVAFVIGMSLPLWVSWLLHGDPGMPGGAGLAILGIPLGAAGAIIVGLFLMIRLRPRKNSK